MTFFYPEIERQTQQLSAKARIIFLDYVPTADLTSLYSMAQALVFASLYEGFGLPVLEAMACGTPVIASDTTSIPEVGGNSGTLCRSVSRRRYLSGNGSCFNRSPTTKKSP